MMKAIYRKNGLYVFGVPPRDLSGDEWNALGSRLKALALEHTHDLEQPRRKRKAEPEQELDDNGDS